MTQQRHNLTWADLLTLEIGGHDKFLPGLSNPEVRFMVASIREHFARQADAANATLERVREHLGELCYGCRPEVKDILDGNDLLPHPDDIRARQLQAILASQPEALAKPDQGCPAANELGDCPRNCQHVYHQPEAPKGPAAEAEERLAVELSTVGGLYSKLRDDLAAANARIAELEARNHGLETDPSGIYKTAERVIAAETALVAEQQSHMRTHKMLHERLDAANARIAGLEALFDQANARADAAERDKKTLGEWLATAAAERDRLAARVTSMQAELDIAWADDDPKETCTPEERKVLEASDEVSTVDLEWCDTLDSECSEPMRVWARAELANRAAKAKANPSAT